MQLDAKTIFALSFCELIALATIVHVWRRKHRGSVLARLLWSFVLLIPVGGVLLYGLTRPHPSAHSDDLPEHDFSDRD